jgi:hypothetical protein
MRPFHPKGTEKSNDQVVGRMGNVFGKGLGGLGSKLGGPSSWF